MTVSVFVSVINKVASWAKATSVSSGENERNARTHARTHAHTHTHTHNLLNWRQIQGTPRLFYAHAALWGFGSFFTQTDYSKPQQFITRHWANIYILQSGLFYIIIYTSYVWMNFNDLNSLILWWWHLRTEPQTVHDDVHNYFGSS